MTKKELAELVIRANRESELVDSAINKLVEVIESAFTALSNLHPEGAIQLIDQMETMRSGIINNQKANEITLTQSINEYSKGFPNSLELEEDYEN